MVKMVNVLCGVLWGAAAACNLIGYAYAPVAPEADMLRSTAAYVQKYDGGSAKDDIQLIEGVLAAARKNPVLESKAASLEQELAQVKDAIGSSENPQVYMPVMAEYAKKLDKLGKDHQRPSINLFLASLDSVLALTYLLSPSTWNDY